MTFTLSDSGPYSLTATLGDLPLSLPGTLSALPKLLQAPQWRVSTPHLVAGQLSGDPSHVIG